MQPLTAETVIAQITTAMHTGDSDAIDTAGALLDRIDQHEHERLARATLGGVALWYAQQGLHVFPLQAGAKIPYKGSRGCKDATSDPERVTTWWRTSPDSNIGIATGHLVDVIDIDGVEGNISLLDILDDLPPRLGQVSTPRPGGRHLYVPATGRGNKAGLLPGIDYRSTGGYVVAPPSVNGAGVKYVWVHALRLDAA